MVQDVIIIGKVLSATLENKHGYLPIVTFVIRLFGIHGVFMTQTVVIVMTGFAMMLDGIPLCSKYQNLTLLAAIRCRVFLLQKSQVLLLAFLNILKTKKPPDFRLTAMDNEEELVVVAICSWQSRLSWE